MRENPHETARGHRGRRRSEAGGVCASAAARFACRLWSLGQRARSRGRGKSATRKLYFWVLLWVYREMFSERTALAPVILCQNRPAHTDTSRTLRPSDCVRCRCVWWFWNFCGGEGGSAGVGEVVFWLVLGAGVGSGLGCGGEIDDDDEGEDLGVSGAGAGAGVFRDCQGAVWDRLKA